MALPPPADETPIAIGAPVQVTVTSQKSEILKGLSVGLGIILTVITANKDLARNIGMLLHLTPGATEWLSTFFAVLSAVWYTVMKGKQGTQRQAVVNYSEGNLR